MMKARKHPQEDVIAPDEMVVKGGRHV